ncbi:MAG TPA: hypothetical protein VNZ57_10770 [Longimicrobiales bacterium]|nr:hypothetical protein [Longimicrobiales bacterium]
MFDELRRAWREAVENFRRELHADDDGTGPTNAAGLARELARAREELRRLEADLADTRRRLEAEQVEADTCTRRERLARDIGDLETAEIAVRFAARHRERALLLSQKASVLAAEHALRTRELQEMEEVAARNHFRNDAGFADAGPSRNPSIDSADFDLLEQGARERAAAARLEELKRNMR